MFNNFTIKARLIQIVAFSAVLAITLGAMGMVGMQKSNAGLETVYNDRTIPLADLSEIKSTLLDTRRVMLSSVIYPSDVIDNIKLINGNIAKMDRLWDAYMQTYLTLEEKLLADKFAVDKARVVSEGLKQAVELLTSGELDQLKTHNSEKIRPLFVSAAGGIDALVQLQKDVAKQEYETAQSRYQMLLIVATVVGLLGIAILTFVATMLIRGISRSLQSAQQVAADISVGILDSNIDINNKDELGVLLRSMKAMQDVINGYVSAQSGMAIRHDEGWIHESIDVNQFHGIYGSMAKELNELVASHVAVKMQVVEIVNQYAKGDFSHDMPRLPGDKAKVTAAIDNVKTTLLSISNEISDIVEAGVRGDFSHRVHADSFDFVFKNILADLNKLIATCELGFGDIERVAKALALGDLTQTIANDYPGTFGQVADAVNETVENLKEMIGETKEAVNAISTAAQEIAAGNNDLSHRTEEQAASLEETAASMEELTTTVQANSANAKQANQLAIGATDSAGKGVNVVGQVISTMEDINESSRKIVDIITVIDGIAFQTNILALNAAVEAARAGDQGRGFAVVAIEVRNLAQRAAAAAAEINDLISDSVGKIGVGTKLVAQAGSTMEEIVNAIRSVALIMTEISAASMEQTSGIEQVNQAIAQMDDVTQQNAALVEQAAASAESLEEQTQNLSVTMSHFKLDSGFSSASSGAQTKAFSSTPQRKESAPAKVVVKTQLQDDWEEF
jgi:methyl-accepting chemotaxis protein